MSNLEEKTCGRCGICQSIHNFYKDCTAKDGFSYICKNCRKQFISCNKEKYVEKSKLYYKQNKEKINKCHRLHYNNRNKQQYYLQKKIYRETNSENIKRTRKKYLEENKVIIAQKRKEYNQKNAEKIKEQKRNYYQQNKCKRQQYVKNKRKINSIYKFTETMRVRIRSGFKGIIKKSKSTEKYLGCTFDFFIDYIKKQLEPGMSMENYGEWEIDHIRPVCTINFNDEQDIMEVFHYTNCRPLWKKQNRLRPHDGSDIGHYPPR